MRRFLLPLAFLLVLAASACGGSGSTGTDGTPSSAAAQAVSNAGQKSSDAGSARASFTADFTGSASGTMTGEGEFSNREGHLTLQMSDLGGGAFGSGQAELVFSDLVYYMKLLEGAGLPVPPGKEWFKIDLKQLGQTQGLNLEQLTQLSQSDPSQALQNTIDLASDSRAISLASPWRDRKASSACAITSTMALPMPSTS